MANPVGEVQRTQMVVGVTFISQERLGVLFDQISPLGAETKKARAKHTAWLAETLRRLGLIGSSPQWTVYGISVGCDKHGNYGAFVIQEQVIQEAPKPKDPQDEA